MKKLISILIITIMLVSMSIPASAFNYSFSSGADHSEVFGKSTSTDNLVSREPMTENTRRNKDAAHSPPPYGSGSGNIPTDQSSLYHDNLPSNKSSTGGSSSTGSAPSSGNSTAAETSLPPITGLDQGGMLPPTTINSPDILNTLPLYYDDGSVGTLHFPKLNLTVKVYEGETLENMRVGVGRFEFTSAWDGNVGVAGHNRGVPAAIGGIKDFANGEKIIYTTKYGTRTYEVYNIQQIADTDYSLLGWSEDNILTIITCVENTPNMRWAVQFREVN